MAEFDRRAPEAQHAAAPEERLDDANAVEQGAVAVAGVPARMCSASVRSSQCQRLTVGSLSTKSHPPAVATAQVRPLERHLAPVSGPTGTSSSKLRSTSMPGSAGRGPAVKVG